MQFNFSDLNTNERYHLMTQTIIPRPVAWALTTSEDVIKSSDDNNEQHYNLAPFSYFTGISTDPGLLMISVTKKPNGETKDTLINVLKNKKMVIHIASNAQADLVTKTADSLAYGESELTGTELTTTPFDHFPLPRLAQCDVAYGCELYEIKEIGNTPQTLIFLEIKSLYISPDVLDKSNPERIKIAANKVNPLARLGGGEYSAITTPFK